MNIIENKPETYTVLCYSVNCDIHGPYFIVVKDSTLTDKEKKLLSFWHEENKNGTSSADFASYKEETATEIQKMALEMGEFIEEKEHNQEHGEDISTLLPISRVIKYLAWSAITK